MVTPSRLKKNSLRALRITAASDRSSIRAKRDIFSASSLSTRILYVFIFFSIFGHTKKVSRFHVKKIFDFFSKSIFCSTKNKKFMNTKKIGRPKKIERFVHKSFKLPPELADALEEFADRSGEQKSYIIRKALMEYMSKHAQELDELDAALKFIKRNKED